MSAILSADDLNDFISPGVACIKPIETLPAQESTPSISLTDCLACSGCVTSAEAVLVQLQSHNEVLATLDAHPSLDAPWLAQRHTNGDSGHLHTNGAAHSNGGVEGRLFVASVSPQARASLAAVFNVSEQEAGHMIAQLLSGPSGLRAGGHHGSAFTWLIDTNVMREACLVAAADDVSAALSPESSTTLATPRKEGAIDTTPKGPILTSACPGWICYAEKTHPHVLPHLSRLKSPQALAGTLLKSVLSQRYNVPPSHIWHLAIMPCFDKKLEASRTELTSAAWLPHHDPSEPVRDVDCTRDAGSSGGYLYHILQTYQAAHPGSTISVSRGRNADVVEYTLTSGRSTIIRMARFYGFRNIQNLVRRLKPAKTSRLPGGKTGTVRRPGAAASESKDYAYVEVMACPGGCTNGGGQVKASEVDAVRADHIQPAPADAAPAPKPGPQAQKEWLARVDEAYFSGSETDDPDEVDGGVAAGVVNGIDTKRVRDVLAHWAHVTGVPERDLLFTSYRRVQSDVGKKVSDVERVAGLAVAVGGGGRGW
ncbi:iron hydrogenase [Lizonia empirigonia]|nr:iron hydrogenase [Lizonia empirigonia]